MKRLVVALLSILFLTGLVGCDAVQRKFTRKKKTVKQPRIFQLKKYDIKPSPELYEKHFAYYTSWSSELRQKLGQNHKKDVRCIEELIGQLNDMQNLLVDEAAEKLERHIKEYEEVRQDILKERIDRYNFATPLITLEREDRYIKRDFCISRVKNCIKKEWSGEEAERLGMPAPTSSQPATAAATAPAAQQAPAVSRQVSVRQAPDAGTPDDEDAVPSDRVVKTGTQ